MFHLYVSNSKHDAYAADFEGRTTIVAMLKNLSVEEFLVKNKRSVPLKHFPSQVIVF